MSLWKNLDGIVGTLFGVGRKGPKIRNVTDTILEVRNNADSAYAIMRGLDPVGAQDFATKAWVQANGSSGSLRCIGFAIGTAGTYSSTAQIPAGAFVYRTLLSVTTAYSGGATISVGKTGSVSLVMTTAQNVPDQLGAYERAEEPVDFGGPANVLVTIGGGPSVGVGRVDVFYAIPEA